MRDRIEKLQAQMGQSDPKADVSLLGRAYKLAEEAYAGKKVIDGRPMLEHAINVAEILAEYQLDINTVAAGLLHNILPLYKDKPEVLRSELSEDLIKMIQLLESLNALKFSTDENEETGHLRRMFIAMARDVRIIMVKLANRLDVMRHLDGLPESERMLYARETLEIFAPLAHRLGVSKLKSEIEDLAFKWLHPNEYQELKENTEALQEQREKSLQNVIAELKDLFDGAGFSVHMTGRTKHLFSMHKKMMRLGLHFSELFDITAVRIIVEKIEECYQVISMLHQKWTPVPGTFDDYIQEPKPNGYQSLHTVVVGPGGLPVEIQIRTWEMHMTAEYGVAAHWRYKEEVGGGRVADEAASWIRRVADTAAGFEDPKTFLQDISLDPFEDKVFALTPMGRVLTLPAGATPIDAAYTIHTNVGHRCIGAKVNNRIVSLDTRLRNGDVVEILTGKTDRPSRDWLKMVRSATARQKIKQWFKKVNRDENISHGKSMLDRELDHAGLKRKDILNQIGLDAIVKSANLKTDEDLYAGIGCGDVSVESVVQKLRKSYREILQEEEVTQPRKAAAAQATRRRKRDITVEGISDILVTFSKCCYPLPGDDIVGFVSHGRGISIHRHNCPNIREFVKKHERIVPVSWEITDGSQYMTEIEVHSLDRAGLLNEILAVLSESKMHLLGMKSKVLKDTTLLTEIRLEVASSEQARSVISKIMRVEDVLSANRRI